MTTNELRIKQARLTFLKTIEDGIEVAEIFLEHLWNIINDHINKPVSTYAEKDAFMINQMMFTKLTHLKKLLEGVGYTSPEGGKLNEIVDPTIISSLVRNIFETTALFNLMFRQTKSSEEMVIIYNLWSISGLNYRQKFESSIEGEEGIERLEEEKKEIDALTAQIKGFETYKNLEQKSKEKIDSRIEQKDFRIVFNGNKIKCYTSWQELCNVMEIKEDIAENCYTYFSLYTHPSQVAVFQFEQMFSRQNEEFKSLTAFNLKYCFFFLSVFIADYINLFPETLETYERLSVDKQIIIESFNSLARNRDFAINNVLDKLE
ncbi:hypothetical protein [Marinifilum sp.]|uniref:hypothetical protein n=1 Tax=Marinifilum sp. TaxID=2033137 RepID=UPI003BAB84F5